MNFPSGEGTDCGIAKELGSSVALSGMASAKLAVSGSIGRALILAGLGFGIVSAVDNVLRPVLLSGGTRMNGLLILIALLGGMRVFGALGLVLGPLLVAVAIALLNTYTAANASEPAVIPESLP